MRQPAVLAIVANFLLFSVYARSDARERVTPLQVPFNAEHDEHKAIIHSSTGVGINGDVSGYSGHQVWTLSLEGMEYEEREGVRDVIEVSLAFAFIKGTANLRTAIDGNDIDISIETRADTS